MELVFGRVGFEREILGVKEEGRGRFVVGDAGVCVWREMRRGAEFRLRGGVWAGSQRGLWSVMDFRFWYQTGAKVFLGGFSS